MICNEASKRLVALNFVCYNITLHFTSHNVAVLLLNESVKQNVIFGCMCMKEEMRSGLWEQDCDIWFCLTERDWSSGPLWWTLGHCQGILGKLLWSELELSEVKEKGNDRDQKRGRGREGNRKASSQHQAGSEPVHRKLSSWAETETPTHTNIHRTRSRNEIMLFMYEQLYVKLVKSPFYTYTHISLTHMWTHSTLSVHCISETNEKGLCVCVCVKNEFSHPAQLGDVRVDSELKHKRITTNITHT